MKIPVLALSSTLTAATAAFAAEPSEIGVWRLVSVVFVEEGTGATTNRFGEKPTGYAFFAPGGYMSVIINAEGRTPLSGDPAKRTEEQAKLFSTMSAHAGKYRLENGKLIHPVDVAHDPNMVGKDILRTSRFVSPDVMESTTPIMTMHDGRKGRSVVTWRRAP